jgi:hypothetical protein
MGIRTAHKELFYLLSNLWGRYLEGVLSEVGHDVEEHDGQHAQQVHPLHRLLHGQKKNFKGTGSRDRLELRLHSKTNCRSHGRFFQLFLFQTKTILFELRLKRTHLA